MAATGVREELHRLADEIPEELAGQVLEYVRFLLNLDNTPEDDEPETPEEAAAIADGREDVRVGRLVPHEEIKREFLPPR